MAERETTEWSEADAARLMDVLYGEVEDAEHARAELADGERAELDSFASLRTLLTHSAEHEPPARLSAQLLAAAAAEHAPRKAAESDGGLASFLAGLFRPILAHPGVAAAASLVVVAGVAGTLYLGGQHRMAEPTLAKAPVEMPAAEPVEESEGAGGAGAALDKDGEGDLGLDGLAQGFAPEGDDTSASAAGSVADAPAKAKPKAASAPATSTVRPRAQGPETKKRDARSFDFKAPSDSAPARSSTNKSAPQSEAKPAAPPPSPQPTVVGGASSEAGRAPREEARQQAQEEPKEKETAERADSRALRVSAISLAKKGECERALEILARLRKVSSADYDAALGDPAVQACRRPAVLK